MMIMITQAKVIERYSHTGCVGRFINPRAWGSIIPGQTWAADNDSFSAWDEELFIRMLDRLRGIPNCLFVTAPDVVGDSVLTLDRFPRWRDEIAGRGFPVAFVGQDGAEDTPIPWDDFQAWFVGGTDKWKLCHASARLVEEAKARGKWCHMGRVNSMRRIRQAFDFGCDSIDGKKWTAWPDQNMPGGVAWIRHLKRQGRLF
jgi:hypothetical protein